MALTPDRTRIENGLTIHEKIIPWGAVWTKTVTVGSTTYSKGSLYKADRLLSSGTGVAKGVTIHNTDGNANAETYTRATYPNQNMKDSRTHYYVDDVEAWQNLKEDEVGWHAGDGRGGGNETTIAIEIIMRGTAIKNDAAAENNGAKLAAILLLRHGLTINQLYKHQDWSGKYCPAYIIPTWAAFKAKVQSYMAEFSGNVATDTGGGTSTGQEYQTYTVKAGDTLSGIAATYLGSASRYPEIKTLNGLTSDVIKVGQVLKLPILTQPPPAEDTAGYTTIEGTALATAAQMRAYIRGLNPDAPDLADLFIEEGAKEGIRGDVAFAQSCLETGNFKFGGDVSPDQNNYCGLGATGGGVAGNSFETPQLGIRAQIQHLKAYANTKALNGDCVDPRFSYVERGVAPWVEWLGIQENPQKKGWASGAQYGAKILKILAAITNTTAPELDNTPTDWEKAAVEKAIARGIIVGDTSGNLKLHGTPTKAEVLVILDRAGVL